MRIRTLYIATVPHTLGFLDGQVGFLRNHGFEVSALASPGKELCEFGSTQDIPVFPVDMPRHISPLKDLVAVYLIWKHLRRTRPHIVHALTPKAGLLGMISAMLAGVPVRIYHILGFRYVTLSGAKRTLLRRCEWLSCKLAHQVLCVGESLMEYAVSDGICPSGKIRVLANGSIAGVDSRVRFNPERLTMGARETTRRQYGIPQDCLTIGYVGRIVGDKGISELAIAWKILREERPDLHLLIVGRAESQDPIPKNEAELLAGDARIHVTGFVPDVAVLYSAMDILVLPAYREGFPTTPLEAAALGLPVVATSIVGCVDAVLDEITGILVPPKDPESLIEALRRYLKDPVLRNRHGQAGRDRVLKEFRPEPLWEAALLEYRRLFKETDNRRRVRFDTQR